MKLSKRALSLGQRTSLAVAGFLAVMASVGSAHALPCIDDQYGQATGCTAADFATTAVTVTQILDDGCVGPNDTFTFNGTMNIPGGRPNRYDVGFFIANDGGNAKTGSCSIAVVPAPSSPVDDGDSCGDYGGNEVVVPLTNVTVKCTDSNSSGFFDLAICGAWDQNTNTTCGGPTDIKPGTKAKCQCYQAETDVAAPHCSNDSSLCVDDSNPCTDTVCNALGSGLGDVFGCSTTNNTASCNDGQFCTINDVCSAGTCGGSARNCTDSNVCTTDSCNEGTDVCDNLNNTIACNDDQFCTVNDVCGGGTCGGSARDCTDSNVCTTDSCNEGTDVCDNLNNTIACNDGQFCTVDDVCSAGVCNGSARDCADVNGCTDDSCNEGTDVCDNVPNAAPCDDGAYCTVEDVCSGGTCGGSARNCSDGIDCTDDSCNEASDQCDSGANDANCDDADECTADNCSIAQSGCVNDFICTTDICRSAGFWSTHSGYEKKDSINIGQLLIDTVGPIEVCGQTISATSNASSPYLDGLGLTSNLEGLCMRSKGVKQRQLYRQLVAAAFNCEASGADDCDVTAGKYIDVNFSDCSDLCAGNPVVDGPTTQQCVAQLDCFNNGGTVVDGKCAHGTCASQPDVYCGGAYPSCPDFDLLPQECVDFPGNCHAMPLCNEELGFCPKSSPASSSSACREARGNGCTIDSCN